jgi:hypothetical protein
MHARHLTIFQFARHLHFYGWLILIWLTGLCSLQGGYAQDRPGAIFPVRGFCIAAPRSAAVAEFISFIEKELAPRSVNTLILRVDYNYAYQTHPELRDSNALSTSDVKRLVTACRKYKIRLIPQVNLLGHQSWEGKTGNLLRVYPDFDETPWIKMPAQYKWPNADGLYCKSYCPLHPGVHKVVFDLMDEIVAAFEADAFHAGMDEVFYIGEAECPRCGGSDKAELFAGEVLAIRDHLADRRKELWIWGDRLLDGKTTGLGMWEASMNNTHRAVDLIPRDVVICDWHYEKPEKTAVYFAMKGFRVITATWRDPAVATEQAVDMMRFRTQSASALQQNFLGIMQTVWSDAGSFIEGFYGGSKRTPAGENNAWESFRALFDKIRELETAHD